MSRPRKDPKKKLYDSLMSIADDLDRAQTHYERMRIAGKCMNVASFVIGAGAVVVTGGVAAAPAAATGLFLTGVATSLGADAWECVVTAQKIEEVEKELDVFKKAYLHIHNMKGMAKKTQEAATLLQALLKGTSAASAAGKVGSVAGKAAKAGGKALGVLNAVFAAYDFVDIMKFILDTSDGLTPAQKMRHLAKQILDIDL